MDSQSAWAFLKLLKTMFMKACGNKIKPPDFVSSVNQIALKSKVGKVLKCGQTEATTSEIFQMALNKVWEFISGQMAQDIKETGWLMKCQEEVRSNGRMVVTSMVSSKTE